MPMRPAGSSRAARGQPSATGWLTDQTDGARVPELPEQIQKMAVAAQASAGPFIKCCTAAFAELISPVLSSALGQPP